MPPNKSRKPRPKKRKGEPEHIPYWTHSGTGDSERRTRFRFDIFAILAITAMVVGITGIVVGLSLHKRLYWPEVLTIVGLGVFVRLFFRET